MTIDRSAAWNGTDRLLSEQPAHDVGIIGEEMPSLTVLVADVLGTEI